MEDSEYRQYFNNLEQFLYRLDGDAAAADNELKDREYSCFIENLKEDENEISYSVEFPISSDISILRYEEEEEESFENVDRQRNFMCNSKREKVKVRENSGGFSGKARADKPKTTKKPLEIGVEGGKKRLGDVSCQNRKRDDENKLEEGEESFENVDRQRNFMSNSKQEKAKVRKNPGGFLGKARADTTKTTKKTLEIKVEGGKKRLGDVSGQKKERDDENKLEEGAEADPISFKSSGGSLKLMNCVVKDEVPDSFDKSVMNTTTHHKNDESCSEVEVFTLDNMPLLEGDYMPFVPSKCFDGEVCGDGIRGSSRSQFREKLMDLLKIPYNEHELSNLWREVTERKPAQGVKELDHRRMKSYSTKTEGKSYLNQYEALRKKVEEFRDDRRKVLYLLRGFFFWLKNTPHEGAFQPWMDSLYLKSLG